MELGNWDEVGIRKLVKLVIESLPLRPNLPNSTILTNLTKFLVQ